LTKPSEKESSATLRARLIASRKARWVEAVLPVKQPTVSHHLRILRQAGLVESEREGLWAYYRVRRDGLVSLAGRVGSALAMLSGGEPAEREGEDDGGR